MNNDLQPVIKLKDVYFQYRDAKDFALKGINLEIPKFKYVAILGHNGSGKSTLSKVLVGLYKPQSGKLEIDNVEYNKVNLVQIRKKIGIVFQNPDNQFVGSTVEDDIAFGLENKQIPSHEMGRIIHELSDVTGMNKYLQYEPEKLSGGQKQRVAISSVLALDPNVIIFDEVTSMLDPKGKTDVLKIIKRIQDNKKKTLISITHDMDEAILADTVIVMSNGKIIAKGDPKKILHNNFK